ncbi:MAG: DNA internalization-related competence protein ComEC/Rec2 [Candidatus Brocadiaceae bacterium]|nr:DNA internalization-related competence protein ComEC/Rec2 [Candidatus Brocadiaceae bacterium]
MYKQHIMRRPIIFITLLFILGIYLGFLTDISHNALFIVCLVLLLMCLSCFALNTRKILSIPCLSVFIISVSIAYYNCRNSFESEQHVKHVLSTDKSIHRVTGVIVNPPIILEKHFRDGDAFWDEAMKTTEKSGHKLSFIIRAEKIKTPLGWKKISGFIRVNMYSQKVETLKTNDMFSVLKKFVYGRRVELFGTLFLPRPPGNPGEFDYKLYMKRQIPPIDCFMTVLNINNIKFLERSHGNYFNRFIYALRNFLHNTIHTYSFSNSAPLISSIILGTRIDLATETIDNFMKTGIIHFMAISGFHVGIVILTIAIPLRYTGMNQAVSTGIVLVVIICYAFLTGLNPPVLRASTMAIIFLCSFLVGRQWDITSGIFAAMLIILLRNPHDLFSIGFQMSVLATAGIVYGAPKIESVLFKTTLFIETLQAKEERGRLFLLKKYLRKFFCVSLAAWLATFPLTAYYFHIFTPFVPVVNIIVFPLFWAIIVCGIVLLTVGVFCPPLASIIAWVGSHLDIVLESLVSVLTSVPYTHFYVMGPSQTTLVVYYLYLLLFFNRKHVSISFFRIVLFGLLSANVLLYANILKSLPHPLKVTCLDVGHGCAICVQFPNGKNILYDAGSWQNYDVGKYIIAPFLWSQGIKKIDMVIISHEHVDHWNGLPALIERFSIKSVYSQPHVFLSEVGKKMISALERKHIDITALSYGMALKGFLPAEIQVLNPSAFQPLRDVKINDASCVLKIEYLGNIILLCADIEEEGMDSVMSRPYDIRSTIMQIPHHGSFSENLEKFIQMVQPAYAFINTVDRIVSQKTLDILHNKNIFTLQTQKKGALTFIITKDGVTISGFAK